MEYFWNKCFLIRPATGAGCLCNVYSTQQKDQRKSSPISISKILNGEPSGTCCTTNPTFTEASRISSWVRDFHLTNTRVSGTPRAQGMGQGLSPFRPSLRCTLSQPQFPTARATYTGTDSCQQGVIASQTAISPAGHSHAARRVCENSAGPPGPLRLSSKDPEKSPDV